MSTPKWSLPESKELQAAHGALLALANAHMNFTGEHLPTLTFDGYTIEFGALKKKCHSFMMLGDLEVYCSRTDEHEEHVGPHPFSQEDLRWKGSGDVEYDYC